MPTDIQTMTTVILVSGTTSKALETTVGSVLRLTPPVDIILVDTGCSEDLRERLKICANAEHRLKLVSAQKDMSYAKAANMGAKQAEGKVLLFLSPDGEIPPSIIEKLYAVEAHLRPPFAIGGLVYDEKGKEQETCLSELLTPESFVVSTLRLDGFFPRLKGIPVHRPVPSKFAVSPVLSSDCLFISTENFFDFKGFDETYHHSMVTHDFCWRFTQAGGKSYIAPDIVVRRTEPNPITNPEEEKIRAYIHYFHENFGHNHPQPALWATDFVVFIRYGFKWGVRKLWRLVLTTAGFSNKKNAKTEVKGKSGSPPKSKVKKQG